jgi:hypothetical protein
MDAAPEAPSDNRSWGIFHTSRDISRRPGRGLRGQFGSRGRSARLLRGPLFAAIAAFAEHTRGLRHVAGVRVEPIDRVHPQVDDDFIDIVRRQE